MSTRGTHQIGIAAGSRRWLACRMGRLRLFEGAAMIAERHSEGDFAPTVDAQGTGGPTALRILLGGQLRRLREAAGITRLAAGGAIRASEAKISRLELGRVGYKERDVADLLTLYGVSDTQERSGFLDLTRQASAPGWWHQYGDVVPNWFSTYVGLEQAASTILNYEVQFVPGLFQTEDYARAVISLGHVLANTAELDLRVRLRVARQARIMEPEAPTVWAVMDEAALRRLIGGREVMRAQVRHLIELCEQPNLTLQILPFNVGGHAAAGGPFSIMRFAVPDLPDIVYLEQLTSALYLDKASEVERYKVIMDRVSVESATPVESRKLLKRALDDL